MAMEFFDVTSRRTGGLETLFPDWRGAEERVCVYSPQRDGLTACERCSVVCVDSPKKLTDSQRYWFDYFAARSDEVSRRYGKPIDMRNLKPYTGTHNSGYTECQEFYGAITLGSKEPLGNRIVTMLDVAVRGYSRNWNAVRTLNELPISVQHFVGRGF